MKLIQFFAAVTLGLAAVAGLTSCEKEEVRTPPADVFIGFPTIDQWRIYGGIEGALYTTYFNRGERVPSNFPWTARTNTGYGGILLVGTTNELDPQDVGVHPEAYDASCPVENDPKVRIAVDMEHIDAYCPKCGSRFDIFANYGAATKGPARDNHYKLRRYLISSIQPGFYRLVMPR